MTEEKNLQGLGGWLILVGFGIVISPLRIIGLVLPSYVEIFTNGAWETLTTPGTQAYNPLWSPIILGEMGINILLVAAWIFIAYLFFTKKALFPKWYIGVALFTLAFIVMDAYAITLVLPEQPMFDDETMKELARSLVSVLIWVPYMLVSKRVKATFIN
jgi:uncharacterized membrane protein YhdT